MSRYQVVPWWYRARFLQTLVVIFPRKSTQVKIHTKMAIFWLVFSAKNPVKSDKLALIEGKILNLMFLDINILVVPIEIWLRVTHNQRQKTLKLASVLLFRHILKTKSWLECGSSLLNSRMWPGILRDVMFVLYVFWGRRSLTDPICCNFLHGSARHQLDTWTLALQRTCDGVILWVLRVLG